MSNAIELSGGGTVLMDATRGPAGTIVQGPTAPLDGLGATVLAEALDVTCAAATNVTLSSSMPVPSLRNTVLPKPRLDGPVPALVHGDRPRYEKKGQLGEGGVGEVVKSMDNDIERHVAIKRLKSDMRAPGHVARFVDEIRTIGSMEHPNIVPIHDVGVDEEGQYFFVMKYVEGDTLEGILEKLRAGDPATHARFGFERRVEIFLGVLEAIAYAHARGLIHRDIKPANVMVGPFGEVTVMDWGLARMMKDKSPEALAPAGSPPPDVGPRSLFRTRAGTLLGTPAYMSPEQARAEALDERSDIYSLCVMFHEMLCLEHYLDSETTLEGMLSGVQKRAHKPPSFVASAHQPPTPIELTHFVNKGLAKDPTERYASVDEMIERLRRRNAGDFPIQCPITFAKRSTTWWTHLLDRHPFLVSTLMILWALGALGGGTFAIAQALR